MGCSENNVELSLEILGEPITVIVKDKTNKLIIDYKTKDTDTLVTYNLCLNSDLHEIALITKTVNTVSYNIKFETAILRTANLLTFSYIHKISLSPDLTVKPTITLESKQLYLGVTYYLYPSSISGRGCKSFISDDNNYLPPSMIFNSENGGITGKLMGKFAAEIKINCVDRSESISATVKYVVKECPAYSTIYELKIESKASGNNILVILENSNKVLYSIKGVPDNKEYIFSGCYQYTAFKLTMSSKDGTSWSAGTNVTFVYGGISKWYRYTGTVLVVTESNYTPLSSDPKWMYSDVFEENWYNKFDTSLWSRSELSKMPNISATTRYYRIIYDLIMDYELLNALKVTTAFKGGMVFFVNDKEVMKENLPLISGPDSPPSQSDDKVNYEFELSGNLIRKGVNYIGVEVHRIVENGKPENDGFRIKIEPLITDQKCVAKTLFITMTPMMKVESSYGDIHNYTFDMNYATEFISDSGETNTLPPNSDITYNYPQLKKSFNEYSIVTIKDCPNRDLKSWNVYAEYGSEFQLISSISDGLMEGGINENPGTGRNKVNSYKISNSYKSYSSYKLEMLTYKSTTNAANHDCDNKYGFAEFYVSNCKEMACGDNDGYLQTSVGSTGFKNCEEGKIGRKEKLCSSDNGNPTWKEEKDECVPVSKSISYGTTDLVFSVDLFKEYPATMGQGEQGYIEIIGTLPSGVSINEKTGRIYGTPTKTLASTRIYSKYNFLSGSSLISQQLTIKAECK